MQREYISLSEVARLFGTEIDEIENWIVAQKIPPPEFKTSQGWRWWNKVDIDRLIAEHKEELRR